MLLALNMEYKITTEHMGLLLRGRALALEPIGPGIEPPPGHGWCGRQASLTLAVYNVHSFKIFLIFKVGQMFIVNNHTEYK